MILFHTRALNARGAMCGSIAALGLLGATAANAQLPPEPAAAAVPAAAGDGAPARPDDALAPRYDGGIDDVDRALARSEDAVPVEAAASRARDASAGYRGVSVRGRARPEFDAAGLRFGSFHLLPSAGTDVGFNSNVFATTTGQSDIFTRPFAEVIANSDWSRNSLRLEGDLSHRYYRRFQTENGTEYRLAAIGGLDVIDRSRIGGELVHERVIVDRANVGEVQNTLEPLRYTQTLANLNGTLATGRLLTTLTGIYTDRNYRDNALLDGTPLSLAFRDYIRRQARVDLAYEVQGTQYVFVSGEIDRLRFKQRSGPFGFDSNGYQILGGVRGELTALIRGQIGLGFLHQNFPDPSLRNVAALGFDTRLEWLVTTLTTLTLTAKRDTEASAIRNDLSYVATTFSLREDHEWFRNVLLLGEVQYEVADYRATTRKDHLVRGVLGVDWLVNRHIRTGARVFDKYRTSSATLRPDFNDFGTTLSLSYAL